MCVRRLFVCSRCVIVQLLFRAHALCLLLLVAEPLSASLPHRHTIHSMHARNAARREWETSVRLHAARVHRLARVYVPFAHQSAYDAHAQLTANGGMLHIPSSYAMPYATIPFNIPKHTTTRRQHQRNTIIRLQHQLGC